MTRSGLMFLASLGPRLVSYAVDVAGAALAKLNDHTCPADVQYACAPPTGRFLYVVSSNGGPGDAGTAHYASAFRIDWESGALHPHGPTIPLPSRPIHITTDAPSEHVLIAYNNLRTVTVLRIETDGTMRNQVVQPESLDTGTFAHQIQVTPSNQVAILVARGNDASGGRPEDPGALKVFHYRRGVLRNRISVAPGGGYGFGPRNVALHPTQPWAYVSLERQNKLHVFRFEDDSIGAEPLFRAETLLDPYNCRQGQMAGAVHVHPSGRFVYLANRAFAVTEARGRTLFLGGENSIAVYAMDEQTGNVALIQHADTQGIYPRTFALDPSGRLLIVANQRTLLVPEGSEFRTVPANLATFSILEDGTLRFMRRYDLDASDGEPFWSGMVEAC